MRWTVVLVLAASCLGAPACDLKKSSRGASQSSSASASASAAAASSAADPTVLINEADALYKAGRLMDAEAKAREVIALPTAPKEKQALAWSLVGLSLEERDDLKGALEAHEKAVELDPKMSRAWINKGITHRRMNDLEAAEKAYRKGLDLNPGNADGWASLGALHIVRKEPAKAAEVLEMAVKLEDDNAVAHSNLAIAYAQLKRFDDAERELKKAVSHGYKNEAGARRMIDEERAK